MLPTLRPLIRSSIRWRTVSGRAGDHMAALDQVLPGQLGIAAAGRGVLRQGAGLDGLDGAIARGVGEARIDVQAAVVEVVDVLGIEPLGLLVGLGHADGLGEAGAIGRGVGRVALGHPVPVALHQRLGADVAGEAEVGIGIGVVDAEVVGLHRAAAGDVDRRMRLLDRPRPDVDVAQLVVAAVEGERLALGPGADDQLVRLGVFLAGQGRDLAVAVVGVHRGADRESRPPAARR